MACFWTDLVGLEQECPADGGGTVLNLNGRVKLPAGIDPLPAWLNSAENFTVEYTKDFPPFGPVTQSLEFEYDAIYDVYRDPYVDFYSPDREEIIGAVLKQGGNSVSVTYIQEVRVLSASNGYVKLGARGMLPIPAPPFDVGADFIATMLDSAVVVTFTYDEVSGDRHELSLSPPPYSTEDAVLVTQGSYSEEYALVTNWD